MIATQIKTYRIFSNRFLNLLHPLIVFDQGLADRGDEDLGGFRGRRALAHA